jgi:hypothetical protein
MGGEQQAVLVFGSKMSCEIVQWIYQLKIVDIVEFAKMKRGEDEDEQRYSDEDIFWDVYEVDDEAIDKMDELLSEYNLSRVYEDNCNWEECRVGMIVDDYETANKDELEKVKLFCEKYNFTKPTFFAGIIGEYE